MTAGKLARHKDNSAQTYFKYALAYFSSYIRPCQHGESIGSEDGVEVSLITERIF